MQRFAVGLEYDGSRFCGWQTQRSLATLQSCLEAALSRVADAPIQVTGAGRTDTGVHAREQVAHFDSAAARAPRAWVLGTNTYLPPTMSLRWACAVPSHFHARYSAQLRTYRYCILNRGERPALAAQRAALVRRPLDVTRMHEAGQQLLGEHDFSALRSSECQASSPVRRLTVLRVVRRGDYIVIEVSANAFLHHMVRNIAGMLIAVGQGDASPGGVAELLAARERRLAPPTAPSVGLYLWKVHYPPGFELPGDSAIMPSPAGCPADLLD